MDPRGIFTTLRRKPWKIENTRGRGTAAADSAAESAAESAAAESAAAAAAAEYDTPRHDSGSGRGREQMCTD